MTGLAPGAMMCGVVRRLQALAARGHQLEWIVNTVGIPRPEVEAHLAVAGPPVTGDRYREVAAAYDQHDLDDPQRGSWINRRIEAATTAGWLPPERWAPEIIDDPYAEPLRLRTCTQVDLDTAFTLARRGEWSRAREAVPDPWWLYQLAKRLQRAGTELEDIGRLSAGGSTRRTTAGLKRAGQYLVRQPERSSASRIRQDDCTGPRLILVTGSRGAVAPAHAMILWAELIRISGGYPAAHVLIHGAAPGADQMAARIAATIFGWEVHAVPADWEAPCRPECPASHRRKWPDGTSYCPAAGPYRNQAMVIRGLEICRERNLAPYCLALPIGWSAGTTGCEALARSAGYRTRRVELTPTGRRPPR